MPVNVVLKKDLPAPGPIISTNSDYIKQVLTNLFTNAWEAIGTGSGTVSLRVKTVSPAQISAVNLRPIGWQPQASAYACLEVADSGCGIATNNIEQIFDPFFTDKFTGRGMGLPVVLGILKTHNGALTVESEPKQGSTFRLFFPLSEEVLLRPQKPGSIDDFSISASSPAKFEGGGTVLVVEDDEMLCSMVGTMLESFGFSVMKARDGVEALEIFGQHQSEIKFVLSDLTMPRMNGWETLTALRKLQPGIPVILASGYDKAHVMAGDHPELPQAFLGKPYKLKELGDAIGQVLSNEKK
jgi:CheY-like chemotaxis protein